MRGTSLEDNLMTRSNHSRRRDVRAYMAEHGVSYTEALRALAAANSNAQRATRAPDGHEVRSHDQGGPRLAAVITREHDINHICGHWLGHNCVGCGTCTICDGCYCNERRYEAEEDAYRREMEREHDEHYGRPDRECSSCELDRTKSKNYTECPKCGKALNGYDHYLDHSPPACLQDRPHPRGLDWSHLIGKRISIDNKWRERTGPVHLQFGPSTWTGTVRAGRYRNPRSGEETRYYVLDLDPSVSQPRDDIDSTPFDPREWNITVHDA